MRAGWLTTGLAAECRHWCELILAKLDQDAHPVIAARVFRAAIAGTDAENQIVLMERAIVASERAGDWNGVIVLTSRLAARYGEQGRYEEAECAFERVASIRESMYLEPNADWIGVLVHRAHFLCRQHCLDEAVAAIDEAVALSRRLQRPYHEMSALLNAAEIVFTRGDPCEAIRLASQALAMSATYRHVVAEVCARANCAGYYLAAGDVEAAKREARAAISRGLKVDPNIVLAAILHLAAATAMAGDPATAARLKGYFGAHRLRDEAQLDPSEINSYNILTSALGTRLSAGEFTDLAHQGALLTDSEAAELAVSS
jgi:tetratricopeptide (TPR) repeat protein